ncbi:hypothetical protein ScalyP_jg3945 [Parmales sp. scaly parma]|nr:hypothetical protein ScalyP_jg3945 [Parmales sp. scaly parma]
MISRFRKPLQYTLISSSSNFSSISTYNFSSTSRPSNQPHSKPFPVPKNRNNRVKKKVQDGTHPWFNSKSSRNQSPDPRQKQRNKSKDGVLMNMALVDYLKDLNINMVRFVEPEERHDEIDDEADSEYVDDNIDSDKDDIDIDSDSHIDNHTDNQTKNQTENNNNNSSSNKKQSRKKKAKTPTIKTATTAKTVSHLVSISLAVSSARAHKEDLILVAPPQKNGAPPVVKCINYGKMEYVKRKRVLESVTKSKPTVTKEFRIKVGIGKNDLKLKLNNMIKFLCAGNACKVSLTSKARYLKDVAERDVYKETQANVMLALRPYIQEEKMGGEGRAKRHKGGLSFNVNPRNDLTPADREEVNLEFYQF